MRQKRAQPKAGGAIRHRAGLSVTIPVFAGRGALLDGAPRPAAIEAGFDVIQFERFAPEPAYAYGPRLCGLNSNRTP